MNEIWNILFSLINRAGMVKPTGDGMEGKGR